MTIYVTGSAGFIGSHFVAHVEDKRRDEEVVQLDIGLAGQDQHSILRVLEHVGPEDLVVLLGANPEVSAYAIEPGADVQTNVQAIVDQMWAAKAAKLIILASSFGGLFGEPTLARPGSRAASIDDRPWPVSAYFAGKLALEGYLHAQHKQAGTGYRVARFANVYGGRGLGQLSPWRGVIPDWMQRRRVGRPYDVWGDLEATRDYVHVADVCEALWRLWERVGDADTPSRALTFHIGTGVLTSLKDLGLKIATTEPQHQTTEQGEPIEPAEPAFTFEKARPGYTVAGSRVDVDEMKQVFYVPARQQKWEPILLEEGLRRTWQTYLMEGRE